MAPTPAHDIGAILSIITNSQIQPQVQPPPVQQQPASQAATSDLEAVFAQYAMKNQQVPQAHLPQMNMAQFYMPQMQLPPSVHAPQHPATTFDPQAALSAFQASSQPQLAYGQAAALQIPDLRGILSQFNRQPQAPAQNYGCGAGYQNADNERKRQLDYDEPSNVDYGSKGKRQKSDVKKKVRLAS
jgi:hypothetical protein